MGSLTEQGAVRGDGGMVGKGRESGGARADAFHAAIVPTRRACGGVVDNCVAQWQS